MIGKGILNKAIHDWERGSFCIDFSPLISSLNVLHSKLPLNQRERIPNFRDLAIGSLHSGLIHKLYDTSFDKDLLICPGFR